MRSNSGSPGPTGQSYHGGIARRGNRHLRPDRTHGGYFNNLDRDGTVYDTTKHVWLQGRQAWIFSKLYRTVEPKPAWLEMARLGVYNAARLHDAGRPFLTEAAMAKAFATDAAQRIVDDAVPLG